MEGDLGSVPEEEKKIAIFVVAHDAVSLLGDSLDRIPAGVRVSEAQHAVIS